MLPSAYVSFNSKISRQPKAKSHLQIYRVTLGYNLGLGLQGGKSLCSICIDSQRTWFQDAFTAVDQGVIASSARML